MTDQPIITTLDWCSEVTGTQCVLIGYHAGMLVTETRKPGIYWTRTGGKTWDVEIVR